MIYILGTSHEQTILTEHIRSHEAHQLEKLFDLLFVSMSQSKQRGWDNDCHQSLEGRRWSQPGHDKSL